VEGMCVTISPSPPSQLKPSRLEKGAMLPRYKGHECSICTTTGSKLSQSV